ncbi:hypothetical protein [Sphingomonas profundi]|uniref:hypothetical protein n=1 Tax=Alterirhizorhabdus profundi TaxID=2681549 RepID=UPI0012E8561D|nr:hypothetical protein [Sphingomonas profundi]
MTDEPTFPADAVPGRPTPPPPASGTSAGVAPLTPPPPAPATPPFPAANDPAAEADASARNLTWQRVGVGAAIGIGSAAVAAALLYVNRGRKG